VGPIRRMISTACATALCGGGCYVLLWSWQAFSVSGRWSIRIVGIGVVMIVLGAFWLWEDFKSPHARR